MKNSIKILTLSLMIACATLITTNVKADDPPPPPPLEHGQNGDQPPGGGAPIGSGLFILLGLSAAYAGKKIYRSVSHGVTK